MPLILFSPADFRNMFALCHCHLYLMVFLDYFCIPVDANLTFYTLKVYLREALFALPQLLEGRWFLDAYEFKIGLIFREDSVQRACCSEWWVAQRKKERRKTPSISCSVNLTLSSASFQTLLPSVYLSGQLIKRVKFYGGKTNILYPYPFPSAECWLRVTLYHDHLLKGGESSLHCPMMYYIQCQGWLMFLVCIICLCVGELDPLCYSLSLMNQRLGRTDTVPWKL